MTLKKLFLFALLPAALLACGSKDVVNPVTPPSPKEPEVTPTDPTPSTGGDAVSMTVCTFNIRYANTADKYPDGSSAAWVDRKAAVKKFFDTVKPDLVGLQEIRKEQSQWFSSQLSSDYGYYDVSRDNASGSSVATAGGEGVGILYRKDRFELVYTDFFWLDPTPRVLPAKNDDGTYGAWHSACRRVTVYAVLKDKKHNNSLVYFFPTHYDHKSNEARKSAADFMLTQLKTLCKVTDFKTSDVVVFHVGDLNTGYSDGQLTSLNDNLFYARTAISGPDQYTRTFNGFGDSNKIIDHIYYGGKCVKPVKYWVEGDNATDKYGVPYLSDHNAVLFQWEYQ